jgi:hypothetical protein
MLLGERREEFEDVKESCSQHCIADESDYAG